MEQERPSERKYTDFDIEFKTLLYIIEEAKEEIVSKKSTTDMPTERL
jgi:hypothetical protein